MTVVEQHVGSAKINKKTVSILKRNGKGTRTKTDNTMKYILNTEQEFEVLRKQ